MKRKSSGQVQEQVTLEGGEIASAVELLGGVLKAEDRLSISISLNTFEESGKRTCTITLTYTQSDGNINNNDLVTVQGRLRMAIKRIAPPNPQGTLIADDEDDTDQTASRV